MPWQWVAFDSDLLSVLRSWSWLCLGGFIKSIYFTHKVIQPENGVLSLSFAKMGQTSLSRSVGDRVALYPSLLTKTLSWGTPCCLYCPMQFLWDKFHEGELGDWGDVSEPEQLASHSGASTEGAASRDLFLQQQCTEACSVLAATAWRGQRWVPQDFLSQRRSSLGRQGHPLRCPP